MRQHGVTDLSRSTKFCRRKSNGTSAGIREAGFGTADDIDVGASGRCRASVLQLFRVTRWWPRRELEWPNVSEGSIVSLAASVDVPGHDGPGAGRGGLPPGGRRPARGGIWRTVIAAVP